MKSLAEAQFVRLLKTHWKSNQGKVALSYLQQLADIGSSDASPKSRRALNAYPDVVEVRECLDSHEKRLNWSTLSQDFVVKPLSLPVAAAQHPTHLKKLKRLPDASGAVAKVETKTKATSPKSHAEILLSEDIERYKRLRRILGDAISRLKAQVDRLRGLVEANPVLDGITASQIFWLPTKLPSIDPSPHVTKKLLIDLGYEQEYNTLVPDTEDDGLLDINIARIRTQLLVPYPAIPQISAPRLSPLHQTSTKLQTRIPQRKNADVVTAVTSHLSVTQPHSSAFTPSKSIRSLGRKSVRFSSARRRTGRPSMFGGILSNQLDDEIDKVCLLHYINITR